LKTSLLHQQSGQAITEAILILVLLLGFTFTVANYFKGQELLKQLVTGPFASLAGVFQNGVWAPPDKGAASHPTNHSRHIGVEGEPVQ
jgi:hypothetical protein